MYFKEKVDGGADIYHEDVRKIEQDDGCLIIHYKGDKESKHVHADYDSFEIHDDDKGYD